MKVTNRNLNFYRNKADNFSTKQQSPAIRENLQFTGHLGAEKVTKPFSQNSISNNIKFLIHETALFRDSATNDFVKKYIEENFHSRDKIKIVVGACSSGEEAITQSMLLDKYKNKVDILGFDLSKQSIEEANSRKFLFQKTTENPPQKKYNINLYRAFNDVYLWNECKEDLTAEQKHNKELFNDFFEPTNEVAPVLKKTLPLKIKEWYLRKVLHLYIPNFEGQYFKLKAGKADNVKFVHGDIMNVNDILKGQKVDVFFFRNAMYHLITEETSGFRKLKTNTKDIVTEIATQVKENLNPKGLFILGDEEWMQTMDSTIIPRALHDAGFSMLYIEPEYDYPTVWQSV